MSKESDFVDLLNKEMYELKIADLEAKLAESEKKAYSRGHSQRDIANELKLNALREDVANKEKRIVELKQQLAEKEKERQLKLAEELLIKQEKEYDEQLEKQSKIHYSHLKEKKQDKISFAVEQLEKVKGLIANHTQELWTCENDEIDVVLYEEIDKQINELKGKVE